MSTITPDQMARLPRYARAEIENLRRSVVELRSDIAGVNGTTVGARLVAELCLAEIPLPDDTTVRWQLGDSWRDTIYVRRVDHAPTGRVRLLLHSDTLGLYVAPKSGNVVEVFLP